MKKFIFTIAALFLGISQMSAQQLIFEDVDLPKGGQVTLTVKYTTGGESLTSASFTLSLPAGVSSEKNSVGKSKFVVNSDIEEFFTAYTTASDAYGIAATTTGVELPGPDGILGTITLFADADAENLVVGESYPVTLTNVSLVKRSDAGPVSIYFEDLSFNVNIVENRIELDENATTVPASAENVNVKVLRSINANSWSTICLPFAMDEDQVVEAFGTDVKIAEFTGCTWGDDKNILLDFTSKTEKSIDANIPYIIMISEAITHDQGFNVDNVTIAPEREPAVEVEGGDAAFIGTYEALEGIGSNRNPVLFIAQNKFWSSKGTANLKAYRGYFEIDDLKNYIADAKIGFFVNDEATLIDGMGIQFAPEGVYDLSGRKIQLENGDMNKLQKGVYIINGKKVTIK